MRSRKIAKRGKPFADEDFVKECLQSTVEVLCPLQAQAISNISLSGVTIAETRGESRKIDIFNKLKCKCKKFEFHSAAIDESTDATFSAQVDIFIRCFDDEFVKDDTV
ncbi:hypothetical protein NPIL_246231 [Nephila pilipes]|uniref:Uncharacterized protein n=1 Tax=Nephila pilipes TaxID=299642 RepID=A0A8X6N4C5_NEPPI|nr:hypothetical protein NPIL_246231 [Nephila pilipes]